MRATPQEFRRILIVGAGTLGQVFGVHLALHGVAVTYLVRPVSRAPEKIRIRSKSARKIITLDQPKFLTQSGLRGKVFEAIFVATRTENLSGVIKTLIGNFKTLPPLFLLCPVWGEAQIEQRQDLGDIYYLMPGVVAYDVDGVQVYRAGVSRIGAIGQAADQAGKAMAFLLHASGLPCRFDRRLLRRITQPSLALIIIFALIEIYHGQFRDMKLSSVALKSGLRGMKQAVGEMGNQWGVKNLTLETILRLPDPVLRLLVWALLKTLPGFYRKMLTAHAHKISAQTRLMMDEAVRELGDRGRMREFEKFVLMLKRAT